LRDIKKTNSKKYGGVGETLLRQNFCMHMSFQQVEVAYTSACTCHFSR
jgi:hypothetical protein